MTSASCWPELLGDVQRAGVHRAPADTSGVAEAAETLHYACLRVDLEDCRDKACLLRRFAQALAFPEWFGHNWDALADCLTDLEWLSAAGYVVIVERGAEMAAAAEADFATALAVFSDAAAFWRQQGVAFWVIVDAGAASSSLPALI